MINFYYSAHQITFNEGSIRVEKNWKLYDLSIFTSEQINTFTNKKIKKIIFFNVIKWGWEQKVLKCQGYNGLGNVITMRNPHLALY